MTDVKHTAGPWHFDRGSNEYGNQSPDAPLLGTIIGDDFHIAVVVSDVDGAEANARLIAAAPTMYAALKDIEGFLKRSGYDTRLVREVLAEASGETP